MPKNSLFLTDVDNCLLDWSTGFKSYINKKHPSVVFDVTSYKLGLTETEINEYVEDFNSSEEFAQLKPYADAKEIIPKLCSLGYKLVAISTCIGKSPKSQELRERGLKSVFGDDVFEQFICLPLASSKFEALQRFTPTYWIDDKLSHSIDGAKAGHISFNMVQPYNVDVEKPNTIIPVNNWQEVYEYVLKNDWKSAENAVIFHDPA